jgi:succinate-acetate transporter protein
MSNTLATQHTNTTAADPAVAGGPGVAGPGYGAKDGYGGGYGGHHGLGHGGGNNGYWNLSNDPNFVGEPGFPRYNRRIANPGPLGMFAQAVALLLWGFYIVRARGIAETSFFVGMALAVGGIVQFLAGMWEFRTGNTFAATQFSMYGGFWFAVGLIYLPGTGGTTAYGVATPDIWGAGGNYQFHQAVGFFFLVWWLFTTSLLLASFRSSITLALKLFLTWLMFLLFFAGEFTGTYNIIRAGGGVGIAAGFVALYQATAALMTHETSFFPMHRGLGELPKYNYDGGAGAGNGAGVGGGAGRRF